MSTRALLGRAARLQITPAPTTLSDSFYILKWLQTHGAVEAFLNPRYVPVPQHRSDRSAKNSATLLAIFDSPQALSAAVATGQQTIETGLDVPDPRDEDPYNVRGLRDRISVPRKKFTCKVQSDADPETRHETLTKQNAHHGSFALDRLSLFVKDIQQSGAPVEGLAAIPSSFSALAQGSRATSALPIRKTSSTPPSSQSLTALYTEAMATRAELTPVDEMQREQARLSAKQRRAEINRLRRLRWKENKYRRLQWVKQRQAEMDADLRGQLEEIFRR